MAAQQKEFEKIQADLMPIIEKIAKENGFSLVLDLNTAGVTYFEPGIDITEQVVKAYDAQSAAAARSRRQEMNCPLTIEDIKKILPHRYPFLLVDRVTASRRSKDRSRATRTSPATRTSSRGTFPATRSCRGCWSSKPWPSWGRCC